MTEWTPRWLDQERPCRYKYSIYALLLSSKRCLYCTNVISRQHLTQSFSLWASWAEHPCWRRQLLPHCCWSAGCWQSCRLMRLPRSALPGRLWLGNHTVRFCMTCTWREETSLMILLWIFPSWAGRHCDTYLDISKSPQETNCHRIVLIKYRYR